MASLQVKMKLDQMPPEMILTTFRSIHPPDIPALSSTSTTFRKSFLAHESVIIGGLISSIRRSLPDDLLHLAMIAVYLRSLNAKVDYTAKAFNPTKHSERLIDIVERSFSRPITSWTQEPLRPVDVIAIIEFVKEVNLITDARANRLVEGDDDFMFRWKNENPGTLGVFRDKLPLLIFEICCQCVLRHGEVLDTAEETRLLDRVARVVCQGAKPLLTLSGDTRVGGVWSRHDDLGVVPGHDLKTLVSWMCRALETRLRHAVRKVVKIQAIPNQPCGLYREDIEFLNKSLSSQEVQESLESPTVLPCSTALAQRVSYFDRRFEPLDWPEHNWRMRLGQSLSVDDIESMPASLVDKLFRIGILQSAQVVGWEVSTPLYRVACAGEDGSGDREVLFIKTSGCLRAVASLKTVCQREDWTRLDEFSWVWYKVSAGIRTMAELLRMGELQSREHCRQSLRGLNPEATRKALRELQSYNGHYPSISSLKSFVISCYAPNQTGKPGPWKHKPFVEEVWERRKNIGAVLVFRAAKWFRSAHSSGWS